MPLRNRLLQLIVFIALLFSFPIGSFADDSLALEKITLTDNKQLAGLILGETKTELEFAEILRPPGKPMAAIIRMLPRSSLAKIERLEPAEKEQSLEQFARFRNRAAIEMARLERVQLDRLRNGDRVQAYYAGPWFNLVSTADDDSTKRIIVKLEQLFLAFRQVLPPRVEQALPCSVRIFGSRDEYRDQLRLWGLALDNPAFYSSTERTMVASSNLQPLSEQLAIRVREEQILQDNLRRQEQQFQEKLARLAEELRDKGFSGDEIASEIRIRRGQWEQELKLLQQRVAEVQRRNEQQFTAANEAFFTRLAHEAFHAYVEHQVFPPEKGRLPRWLNEGLAQVFETGQFDGDLFRIDAPSKERLTALKADLQGLNGFSLSKFVAASDDQFAAAHDRRQSERLYRYSWGLAWYLTFLEPRLDSATIADYLEVRAKSATPVPPFEKLVGRSLPEFEKRWQEAILGLK